MESAKKRPLRILLVTPAATTSLKGNGVTAKRWFRILRQLGHATTVAASYEGQPCDVLIALHARHSAASIRRFHKERAGEPMVVALTGTDLYGDLPRGNKKALESLRLASRLVLLQEDGIQSVPAAVRFKTRVIAQSALPPRVRPSPLKRTFEISVASHLRAVKDPLRAAMAARQLPNESRTVVHHYGLGLNAALLSRAIQEAEKNPRYVWHGRAPHGKLMRRLARSRLLVLTSKMEGGANVVSEAIVSGVPVLSTRISGSIGLLGANYPGFFDVGDTRGLAELMWRAETDAPFYARLSAECRARASLFTPRRELQAWSKLLAEFR